MSAAIPVRLSVLSCKIDPADEIDQTDQINQTYEIDETDQTDQIDQIDQINQMSNTPFKQYYRVDEVAEYFAISVRTVYRLIEEGELRRTKIRGCLRIPIWEIERYESKLRKQMVEP